MLVHYAQLRIICKEWNVDVLSMIAEIVDQCIPRPEET